jgi:hypothetical protein
VLGGAVGPHPRNAEDAGAAGQGRSPAAAVVGTNLVVGFFLGMAGFAGDALRLEVTGRY